MQRNVSQKASSLLTAVLIHASRTTKIWHTPSMIQHARSLETPRTRNRAAPLPPTPH